GGGPADCASPARAGEGRGRPPPSRSPPRRWRARRPPPVVPAPPEALPEPEIYSRLAEAMGLFGPPPAGLAELAPDALTPEGAMRFLAVAQEAAHGSENAVLFWSYRTLGPRLPAPSLAAVSLLCHVNGLLRRDAVVRTSGAAFEAAGPFELAAELFRLILAHPEGVEIARVAEETNLVDHLGFDDRRIRLTPEPMLGEIRRALDTPPVTDPAFP